MIVRTTAARQLIKNFGTAFKFPSGGSISLGTANPFTGSFYHAAWVKWYGLNGAFQQLFNKRDSYASAGMLFSVSLVDTTGKIALDTVTSFAAFGVGLPIGKWVHLVWVHNLTSAKDELYIDGQLVANPAKVTLGTKTDALIEIGAAQTGPTIESFNGEMDEIVIGTGAPTQADVLAMRNNYIYANQWAYLKLDEGTGSTATDSSGNGNNGTIAGGAWITDKVTTTRSTAARFPVTGVTFLGQQSTTPNISVPNASAFKSLTALTVEMYLTINAIASTGFARIIDYNTTNKGFSLYFNNKLLRLSANVGNNTTQVAPNSNTVLSRGRIYHVALVWDRSNVQFYISGTKDSIVTPLSGGNTGDPGVSLYIGNEAATDRAGGVSVRELRISNIARYSVTFTPPTGPLPNDANTIELFKFQEGSGTTTTGVNGNIGTFGGTPLPIWLARTAV